MTFAETCRNTIQSGRCNGDCCGVQIFPAVYWIEHMDKAQVEIEQEIKHGFETAIITGDGMCVFLNRKDKKCAIYKDRPQLCKDYGHIEELQCPFIKMNGNQRSEAQQRRTQRKIKKEVDNRLERLECHK